MVSHDSCSDSRSTECFPFDETRAPPTREIQCVSSPDAHFCPAVLTTRHTCAHHRNINRNQTRRYSIRKGNCSIAWHCTFHTHSIYFIGDEDEMVFIPFLAELLSLQRGGWGKNLAVKVRSPKGNFLHNCGISQ